VGALKSSQPLVTLEKIENQHPLSAVSQSHWEKLKTFSSAVSQSHWEKLKTFSRAVSQSHWEKLKTFSAY